MVFQSTARGKPTICFGRATVREGLPAVIVGNPVDGRESAAIVVDVVRVTPDPLQRSRRVKRGLPRAAGDYDFRLQTQRIPGISQQAVGNW